MKEMSKENLIFSLQCFFGYTEETAIALCQNVLGAAFDTQEAFAPETAIIIATYA